MIELPTTDEPVRVVEGDCLEAMPRLPADTFDSIVSDPPYGLGFMGKQWDHGVPGVPFWTEAKRVLKPGAYMLVMGGSRTYHRLACAVEDAGFEIRDCLMWIYGSGFPKAKSCLKPAYEPILLCRKPGKGMRELGVDECRVPISDGDGWDVPQRKIVPSTFDVGRENSRTDERATPDPSGRWPANVLHDGSEEVMAAFAVYGESTSKPHAGAQMSGNGTHEGWKREAHKKDYPKWAPYDDSGTAARFFYAAKASKAERDAGLEGMPIVRRASLNAMGDEPAAGIDPVSERFTGSVRNTHPTVKPLALMEWLVKLVTPKDGCTLDPFAGSGTTGKAAANTGRRAVLIEREAAYADIARRRTAEPLGTGLLAGVA